MSRPEQIPSLQCEKVPQDRETVHECHHKWSRGFLQAAWQQRRNNQFTIHMKRTIIFQADKTIQRKVHTIRDNAFNSLMYSMTQGMVTFQIVSNEIFVNQKPEPVLETEAPCDTLNIPNMKGAYHKTNTNTQDLKCKAKDKASNHQQNQNVLSQCPELSLKVYLNT